MPPMMMFYAVILLLAGVTICVPDTLSDRRLCGDPNCAEPIATGITEIMYSSIIKGGLSFRPNQDVIIFSKGAGCNDQLWGVKIGKNRGYAPKKFIKEMKIIKKPEYELPVEADLKSLTCNPYEEVSNTIVDAEIKEEKSIEDIDQRGQQLIDKDHVEEKVHRNNEEETKRTQISEENLKNEHVAENDEESTSEETREKSDVKERDKDDIMGKGHVDMNEEDRENYKEKMHNRTINHEPPIDSQPVVTGHIFPTMSAYAAELHDEDSIAESSERMDDLYEVIEGTTIYKEPLMDASPVAEAVAPTDTFNTVGVSSVDNVPDSSSTEDDHSRIDSTSVDSDSASRDEDVASVDDVPDADTISVSQVDSREPPAIEPTATMSSDLKENLESTSELHEASYVAEGVEDTDQKISPTDASENIQPTMPPDNDTGILGSLTSWMFSGSDNESPNEESNDQDQKTSAEEDTPSDVKQTATASLNEDLREPDVEEPKEEKFDEEDDDEEIEDDDEMEDDEETDEEEDEEEDELFNKDTIENNEKPTEKPSPDDQENLSKLSKSEATSIEASDKPVDEEAEKVAWEESVTQPYEDISSTPNEMNTSSETLNSEDSLPSMSEPETESSQKFNAKEVESTESGVKEDLSSEETHKEDIPSSEETRKEDPSSEETRKEDIPSSQEFLTSSDPSSFESNMKIVDSLESDTETISSTQNLDKEHIRSLTDEPGSENVFASTVDPTTESNSYSSTLEPNTEDNSYSSPGYNAVTSLEDNMETSPHSTPDSFTEQPITEDSFSFTPEPNTEDSFSFTPKPDTVETSTPESNTQESSSVTPQEQNDDNSPTSTEESESVSTETPGTGSSWGWFGVGDKTDSEEQRVEEEVYTKEEPEPESETTTNIDRKSGDSHESKMLDTENRDDVSTEASQEAGEESIEANEEKEVSEHQEVTHTSTESTRDIHENEESKAVEEEVPGEDLASRLETLWQSFSSMVPWSLELLLIESAGLSSRLLALCLFVVILCLGFSSIALFLQKRSKEGYLMKKLQDLDQKHFHLSGEFTSLENDLTKRARKEMEALNMNWEIKFDSTQTELQTKRAEAVSLAERLSTVQAEMDNAAEAMDQVNSMFDLQINYEKYVEESRTAIEHLQEKVNKQVGDVQDLRHRLQAKEEENAIMKKSFDEASSKSKINKEKLQASEERLSYLETERIDLTQRANKAEELLQELQSNNDAISQELEEKSQKLSMLEEEALSFKESVPRLEGELKVLRESIKQMKSEDENYCIEELLDAAPIKAELEAIQEEKLGLKELVEKLQSQLTEAQESFTKTKVELKASLKIKSTLERERNEAQEQLDTLKTYWNEKGDKMERRLEEQSGHISLRDEENTSLTENVSTLMVQVEDYKEQVRLLKQEIESQEVSYKQRLTSVEKQSQENWVAARQAERRLDEMKLETAQLRNKLTQTAQEKEALLKLERPHHSNGELNRAGSMDLPIMPKDPMNGPFPPPPPFGAFPPPPPPDMMDMMMPPHMMHPPHFPMDMRPPPLGERMSPPPFSPPPPHYAHSESSRSVRSMGGDRESSPPHQYMDDYRMVDHRDADAKTVTFAPDLVQPPATQRRPLP